MDNRFKGLKATKQRKVIYQILKDASLPLNAQQIFDLTKNKIEDIWLSTVYRTLDTFIEHDVINKLTIQIEKNNIAFYELSFNDHKHYAVCTSCNKLISIANCPMQSFTSDLDNVGFEVTGHNIQIYGKCSDCKII